MITSKKSKRRKNWESCPTEVTWKNKFKCQLCLSCLSLSPPMTCLKRLLEVVHKQVGGCLISYNLQLACVRKLEFIWPDVCLLRSLSIINGEWISAQCLTRLGLELLGQLKTILNQSWILDHDWLTTDDKKDFHRKKPPPQILDLYKAQWVIDLTFS